MFIVIDGGEGVGKSTLTNNLKKHFESQGKEVVLAKEPGGTDFAYELRLLFKGHDDLHVMTQYHMLLAGRYDHLKRVIAPAIERGAVVICDRFDSSTYAHQIRVQEDLRDKFWEDRDKMLSEFNLKPIYVIPHVHIDTAIERIYGRDKVIDRFDSAPKEVHESVQSAYLDFAEQIKKCPHSDGHCVDTVKAPDEVFLEVKDKLEN